MGRYGASCEETKLAPCKETKSVASYYVRQNKPLVMRTQIQPLILKKYAKRDARIKKKIEPRCKISVSVLKLRRIEA